MAAFVRVSPIVSDRLLTCATQAARNVALPVSSPAAQVSKALEARPLINRLAVGLAHKEAGGQVISGTYVHHQPTPNWLECKMQTL